MEVESDWCAERRGHREQSVSEVKFVFLCEEREECVNLQRELERRPTGDGRVRGNRKRRLEGPEEEEEEESGEGGMQVETVI